MTFTPHHVALTVNDIDESVQWYQQKLDFKLIHRYKKHGMEIVHLQLGDVRIELFNYGEKTKSLPDYKHNLMDDLHVVGTKHLCIQVDNLEATIKSFKEKGVQFATDLDTAAFGGRYIFFKDCNNILIELYQE